MKSQKRPRFFLGEQVDVKAFTSVAYEHKPPTAPQKLLARTELSKPCKAWVIGACRRFYGSLQGDGWHGAGRWLKAKGSKFLWVVATSMMGPRMLVADEDIESSVSQLYPQYIPMQQRRKVEWTQEMREAESKTAKEKPRDSKGRFIKGPTS